MSAGLSLEEKLKTGEIRFNKTNTNIKRRTYLNEQKGLPPSNLWIDLDETGHNRNAKYDLVKIFEESSSKNVFQTPKPSKFIDKIPSDADIVKKFELILKKPKLFPISLFRARFPEQKKVIYNWHQDEGTWMTSKDKNIIGKYPVTLWLSINGSNKNNSIQLIDNTHKYKLLKHQRTNKKVSSTLF